MPATLKDRATAGLKPRPTGSASATIGSLVATWATADVGRTFRSAVGAGLQARAAPRDPEGSRYGGAEAPPYWQRKRDDRIACGDVGRRRT